MNETIEKIIGLLFADIEETEETRAIREEILTNCQERYDDLIHSGLSEDDAIHAVMESLKGMEELLAPYPRKQQPAEEAQAENELPHWQLDPAQTPVREIRALHLGSANVQVDASCDGLIHVRCDRENVTLMTGIEDGVLTIGLREEKNNTHIDFSGEFSFDLNDLGRLFEKLAQKFISATTDVCVHISIPQTLKAAFKIDTASGDVQVGMLTLDSLNVVTASGDVEVRDMALNSLEINAASGDLFLDGLTVQNNIALATASGDIEVNGLEADTLDMHCASGDVTAHECIIRSTSSVKTTSGDVEWMNDCPECKFVTVSGDLRLSGECQAVDFSTVSGDAKLMPEGNSLHSLHGTTISGDIQLVMPQGLTAFVSCRTRSGDLHQHVPSDPASDVRVELNSSSGDITVR